MKITSLLSSIAVAIALSGCATDPKTGGLTFTGVGADTLATPLENLCNSDAVDCIYVSVSNTPQGPAINKVNDISVSGANHFMLWIVTSAAYTFTDKGIDFKAAPPTNEFGCRLGAQKQLFICVNRNSRTATYSYNINVKDAGSNSLTLDPKIFNN